MSFLLSLGWLGHYAPFIALAIALTALAWALRRDARRNNRVIHGKAQERAAQASLYPSNRKRLG